ncbi:D-amino-acid transaminase [Sporosarcina siberiensis]|uniref:D-alanine aminotransferase n=1 Tax=Sporosarcina siberiensis TaxID=1365606 RepID=A0ABW4SBC0_9BACL
MRVLVNNEIVHREDVRIDFEDRGYQFGDGIYEVVRVYEGEAYELNEHIHRFYRSAKEIGITPPQSKNEMKSNIEDVITENKLLEGGIYFQMTRGVAPRKHQYEKEIEPKLIAYPLYFTRPEKQQNEGVSVLTADDLRWHRCDIKSLNLLYNIMMKQKAHDSGSFETIFIRDELVTEGTSTNVFMIKDNVISTHPADNNILNGITRMKVLHLLNEEHIPYEEKSFTKQELLDADEVFITSTTSEVMPVLKVDEQVIGNGLPGILTKRLHSLFLHDIKSPEIVRG